jgi:toxin ParE1/3/4
MSGSAFRVVVAPQAARDIAKIVAKSRKDFGQLAAERYEALTAQALIDIGEDPRRLGATVRPDLLPSETYVYHLSFSRDRTSGQKVKEPRHFIGYRIKPQGR